MGGGSSKSIRHGRQRALGELERIYEGPIRGLQIAPEFYKLLGSSELKNTPIGRSVQLQQNLLDEVMSGLSGKAFGGGKRGNAGTLPPDLVSAIGENLNSQLSASGTEGSPVRALQAAMRFSGASESIRQNRIASAQSVLGQIGGASILPSASEFLNVGAQRASQAANIQYQAGLDTAQAKQQEMAGYGSLLGGLASAGLGFAAAPAGFGLAGLLGGFTGRSIGSIDPRVYGEKGWGLQALFGGGDQ